MSALRRIADNPWWGGLIVLLVAAAVYLPRLGADGLAGTEGHRVIPGWELLDRLSTPTVPRGLGTPTVPGGEAQGTHDHQPARAEPTTQQSHGSDQPDASSQIRPAAAPRDGGGTRSGASPSLAAPTMFDRLYLRKPPGMMWAEAASAAAFCRTEWSARFVGAASSIALALVCWGFAWRWFGARAGLAAGIALALTPWLWQSGRSAEIEPLHNLWVALAAFCAIDLLLRSPPVPGAPGTPTVPGGRNWMGARSLGGPTLRGGRPGAQIAAALAMVVAAAGLALAVAGAAAAKGPAGAPVLAGAILGTLLVAMRAQSETSGRGLALRAIVLLLSVAAAGAVIAAVWLAMQRAGDAPGADPVAQGAAEFLWSSPVLEILTLPLAMLVAALPLTLALPQAWAPPGGSTGEPPAGRLSRASPPGRGGYPIARALGGATLISIAAYTLLGVGNVRYVMPVAPLMAPLVGWAVVNGAAWRMGERGAGGRRSLAGMFDWLITRKWWAWTGALLVASQVYIWAIEPSRDGRSGREAGLALGAALPPGAEIWANDLVEAVPETLLYAQRAGDGVRVRWRNVSPAEVPSGVFVVLRSDGDSGEAAAWRAAGELPPPLFEGSVRHYQFIVIKAP